MNMDEDKGKTVLSITHPRWDEFYARLTGPQGCNFRQDDEGQWHWDCSGGTDVSRARAILATMDGIDVAATVDYFGRNGGYCDCEIAFNLPQHSNQYELEVIHA